MSQELSPFNKNVSRRLIYEGLCFIVSVIDSLGYDYMAQWRNDMMTWKVEMEKRYKWLGVNQRSYGYCPKCS